MLRPGFALLVILAVAGGGGPAEAATGRSGGLYPTATPTVPMLVLDSTVTVTVRGPIVETVVVQRFQHRGDRPTEATYIFPLPPDAAVSAMSITYGTRTIRAAIEAREQAQQRYEAAVRAGVVAAVLDQERPDVFTQTVAAVPARGTIEVTLRYDSIARYADGTWSLVLPMVVAPRYVPGTASGRPTTGTGRAPDTDRVPDASRVTPPASPRGGGATTVLVTFADPVRDLTSSTHELTVTASSARFVDAHSDHDAVLRWKTEGTAGGWVEQGPGGAYAAVVVEAPPAAPRKRPVRMTLVLDRAATMKGDAAVVSGPIIRALLGGMTSGDRVAVTGGHQLTWSAPADVLRAIEASPRTGGAFDLTRVLLAARPDGAPLVLVSDGLVADDRAALAAAAKLRVPVHVIGVGPAPARGLLVALAAATGGTVRFALPDDDLAVLAAATVSDVATPPAPLAVTWGTLAASDVVPAVLPRLGAGQAMLVLARVQRAQAANGRARGNLFAIETLRPTPAVDGAVSSMGVLARRWARMRLDDLLVGPEDRRAVTRHAQTYGLVSPYTSLVAIGTDVVVQGGVRHSIAVPVSVPAGMRWADIKQEAEELEAATKEAAPDAKPTVRNDSERDKRESVRVHSSTDGAKHDRDLEAGDAGPPNPSAGRAPSVDESPRDVAAIDDEDDGGEEPVQAREAMPSRSHGRGFRITAALGGGLALQDEARAPMVALSLRAELIARRNLVGAEGSLWLVDGLHGQGRVLVTYARAGLARWLELGLGAGLHLGSGGAGPAGALSLRVHAPPRPALAGYLRYDVGLLRQDDATTQPQHALTLGVEWGF